MERSRKPLAGTLEAPSELVLPPAYAALRAPAPEAVADRARAEGPRGPGRLVWAEGGGRLAFAVTLAPEEPLATARRAIYMGMGALAQAVAAQAAPERSVTIVWPDGLLYDGARLAGGTLLWPEDCAEAETPQWLAFAAEVVADRRRLAEPGLRPGSTSLEEEGLGPPARLVEAFASYLMLGFDDWEARGFDAAARRYADRLPGGDLRIAPNGDAIVGRARQPLAAALAARAWADPAGGVRL